MKLRSADSALRTAPTRRNLRDDDVVRSGNLRADDDVARSGKRGVKQENNWPAENNSS